jgi:hypothetical protein
MSGSIPNNISHLLDPIATYTPCSCLISMQVPHSIDPSEVCNEKCAPRAAIMQLEELNMDDEKQIIQAANETDLFNQKIAPEDLPELEFPWTKYAPLL